MSDASNEETRDERRGGREESEMGGQKGEKDEPKGLVRLGR